VGQRRNHTGVDAAGEGYQDAVTGSEVIAHGRDGVGDSRHTVWYRVDSQNAFASNAPFR